jgi:hypothetical protein
VAFAKVPKGLFGYVPTFYGVAAAIVTIPFATLVAAVQIYTVVQDASKADDQKAGAAASAQVEQVAAVADAAPAPAAAQPPQSATADPPRPAPAANPAQTYVATFTCQVQGQLLGIGACFSESGAGPGGSIKVVNGSEVKQYTSLDVLQAFSGTQGALSLGPSFSITAQMNGMESAVLRLEIHDASGRRVYANETSALGVISASS